MAQLAEHTELSDAYISLLETGKRQPSHKAALKLALVLANNEDQVSQCMVAAGYPNLKPTQKPALIKVSFTEFTQEVLLQVRQGNYLVAEQMISQGLQKFQDTVQIQMLVAHLELARKHPHLAICAMDAALIARRAYPDSHVDFADIYLNMGVCHFVQASHLTQQKNPQEAVVAYQKAADYFEMTLAEAPNHFYALDEYARCLYNLAHLGQQSWKKVVSVYEQVLAERGGLTDQIKNEVLCFSALAYTRSGKQVLAEALFSQILFMSQDAFTLHAYLCHCCYAYKQTQQEKWMIQAHRELKLFETSFPGQMQVLRSDPEIAQIFEHP